MGTSGAALPVPAPPPPAPPVPPDAGLIGDINKAVDGLLVRLQTYQDQIDELNKKLAANAEDRAKLERRILTLEHAAGLSPTPAS